MPENMFLLRLRLLQEFGIFVMYRGLAVWLSISEEKIRLKNGLLEARP
jgi:hypothetical protein